jgi:sphingomyelin phosphodiesterase acid-like 3
MPRLPSLYKWLSIIICLYSPLLLALDAKSETAKFISFSDIHFNPFSSCKTLTLQSCQLVNKLRQAPASEWESIFEKEDSKALSEFTHDTNYALLKSSLVQINSIYQSEHPRFAVVLGDYLAHHFRAQYIMATHDRSVTGYQSFVKKTMTFLSGEFHKTLPAIDVYPALGNNDSYTGDYSVLPGGSFLRDTADSWSGLILNEENQRHLRGTFPIAGFYAVTLPQSKQKLLVLDTVLFSTAIKGQAVMQAAQLQLKWLGEQLQSAAQQHESVLLAFHIPDGVNVYLTLLNLFHGVDEFWRPDVSKQFNEILKQYAATISAILPGHIHMDSFQVLTNDTHEVPVSYTPSISPIFGNNPGFKVYSYNESSLQLTNYDMYFLQVADAPATRAWRKEYSFNQVYHQNCENCNLLAGMKNLTPSGTLANTFKLYYAVSMQSQPIIRNNYWIPYYWCSVFDPRLAAYQTCIKR